MVSIERKREISLVHYYKNKKVLNKKRTIMYIKKRQPFIETDEEAMEYSKFKHLYKTIIKLKDEIDFELLHTLAEKIQNIQNIQDIQDIQDIQNIQDIQE